MKTSRALVRLTDGRRWGSLLKNVKTRAKYMASDLAQRAWGTDFEQRVAQLRQHYAGGDPFGVDPEVAKYSAMVTAFLHRLYFRTELRGLENVPAGRALLIANHSGTIPIDAVIICTSLFLDADPPRLVRSMVEKWAQTLPFISTLFARVGQVVGVPENCRQLLEREELVLAFPEGVRGISKPFAKRYQLERFGHGFMRLALATRSPIVPIAVVGAEEQYINLGNLDWAAKVLGLPVLPIVPQLLVPGGIFPLPTKYHIYFGEPLHFEGDPDDDEAAMEERVWLVAQTIQSMLDRGLEERAGVFV